MNHGQYPLELLRVGVPLKFSTPEGCIGEGIKNAFNRLENILEVTGAPLRHKEASNMVKPVLIGSLRHELS
jgi:hypothetical protein